VRDSVIEPDPPHGLAEIVIRHSFRRGINPSGSTCPRPHNLRRLWPSSAASARRTHSEREEMRGVGRRTSEQPPKRTHDLCQTAAEVEAKSPVESGLGRGLQGRGRGFDMGSITVPDRALQRPKKPSVALVFCKLRPSFSLSRQRSRVRPISEDS
jgi:hypothetical protein